MGENKFRLCGAQSAAAAGSACRADFYAGGDVPLPEQFQNEIVLGPFLKKGVIFLPGVYLNEDEYNFDIALRRFKKQVEKAGILSEMKKRQHYEKPSVMRKKKKAAARKRLMKKMRKINSN